MAARLSLASSRARKPIGARQASTTQTSTSTCSCSCRGDAAGGGLAQRRGDGVEEAAGRERRDQQRQVAEVELRARRPAAGRPRGRRRARRPGSRRAGGRAGRGRAASPTAWRAAARPRRAAARRAGGSSTSIGHEHELRRHDVAGADRELDAGQDDVDADEHDRDAEDRTRRWRPAAAAGRRRSRQEQRRGDDLAHAARAAAGAACAPSQESSRRRSAAASLRMSSVVLTSVGLSVAGGKRQPPVARAAHGPPAVRSPAGVGIDVDVVDRPVSAVVLRIEDELDLVGLVVVPDAEHLRPARRPASAASSCRRCRRSRRRSRWSRRCPFQRTLTFSTPHVPLVRRAKKRNVGCSMPTQNSGETALPVALDRERLGVGRAVDLVATRCRTGPTSCVSDQPALPASNAPVGSEAVVGVVAEGREGLRGRRRLARATPARRPGCRTQHARRASRRRHRAAQRAWVELHRASQETSVSSSRTRASVLLVGGWAISRAETPGFASPPRDGFALLGDTDVFGARRPLQHP